MKLKLKRRTRFPWLFLGLCIVAIPAVSLLAQDNKTEIAVSVMAAIGGLVYFLYAQHHNDVETFRDLFQKFNERFDKLNEALNDILERKESAPLRAKEKQTLYDYFNLCAEEHLFFQAGYIDEEVWKQWCQGMLVFESDTQIRELWESELKHGSYYGFNLEEVRRHRYVPK